MASNIHKRMFPPMDKDNDGKRRRGPKTKDEKLKEDQKSADYWLMRPHVEFLEYRRELLLEKMNYHKKEFMKFKTALDEINKDIGKHTEESESEEEENEVEEVEGEEEVEEVEGEKEDEEAAE